MTDPAPRPRSFTAHRVIRVMTKVCAARDIGLDGFALVCLIGHQWDAVRYRRPVAYHLADLMNLCGVKHKTAFYRIEKRVLAAGWLMKKIRGRRQPSVYWIAIPSKHADVEDTATVDEEGEDITDVSQSVSPTVHQSVSQSVSPFIPSPLPVPSPEQQTQDLFGPKKPEAETSAIAIPFWLSVGGKDPLRADEDRAGFRELVVQHPRTRHIGEELSRRLLRKVYLSELVAAVLEATGPVDAARPAPPSVPAADPVAIATTIVYRDGWEACLPRLPAWIHPRIVGEQSMLLAIEAADGIAAALIAASKDVA